MDFVSRWNNITPFRALLLLLGMLFPLHLPVSLGSAADAEKQLGWWATPRADNRAGLIVVRTLWHASNTGLLPGDVVLQLNGAPATVASLDAFRRNATPGEIASLVILRGDQQQLIEVPVRESSLSYVGYRWYRIALASLAWLIAMGIIFWRGSTTEALLLAGALLLIGPVTVPVAFANHNPALSIGNYVWHLMGGIYRFLLPLLLLLFFIRHSPRRALAESRWVTVTLVLATIVLAALISDGFRQPLAWSTPGFAVRARAVAGLIGETVAVVGLLWIAAEFRRMAQPIQWVTFATFLLLAAGACLSIAMIVFPQAVNSVDALRQIKALALAPLPFAAALYVFLTPAGDGADNWHARVRASALISAFLWLLYGGAVAGAAGITLSIFGLNLGGAEITLFSAIIVATIVFAPLLRWSREFVDRHVFSDWIGIEQQAHTLVQQLHGELQPHRIVELVENGLPRILDVREPRLILAREVVDDWYTSAPVLVANQPVVELERMLHLAESDPACHCEVVRRDSGSIVGVLCFTLQPGKPLPPPAQRALETVVRGVAVALRNSEAYFELQKANQVLSENERVASLADMAGGLAHEIKNPLASLKMGLYLLRRESADQGRLHRIESDVRRIDDLVSSLLRFTQSGTNEEREPIDLNEAVRATVADLATLARDRGIVVHEVYADERMAVRASASELRVMVSTVLHNALDASPSGGVVTVRVAAHGDHAEIAIIDEGPGIPPELRRRVFELNFSTKQGGTGLGLALARREAERLGGRIELRPTARGTHMCIVLPAKTPVAAGG